MHTNSLVVRGDSGLFSLRSRRLIKMARLWDQCGLSHMWEKC